MKQQLAPWLMVGVLLIGAALRFHGLVWTLPIFFLGDEIRVVFNGITIYQFGVQDYVTNVTSMSNYPPLRGWEIALVQGVGNMLVVGDAPASLVVLYGRMLSLFYALLTLALLYQLALRLTHNRMVGIISALLLAVWSETIMFGQRVLSDGAGLLFFTLCALFSVLAYQRRSYLLLVGAGLAGMLAGLGKYNYFPALLFPFLVGLAFLLQRPRQLILWGVLPGLLLALPILYFTARTVSADDLFYNYLNERAQLEGDLRSLQQFGRSPANEEWQAFYERYPLNISTRFATNYDTLMNFLPPLLFPLSLLGMIASFLRGQTPDKKSLWAFALGCLLLVLVFSRFRIVEGRQMFGAVLALLIFAALAVVSLARVTRLGALLVGAALLLPMGADAWLQNTEYAKPDSRVETVRWFLENARNGSGIAIENENYEFSPNFGYWGDKQFNVSRVYRLWEKEPQSWENEGVYYLVADASYAWRGGYYAGHEFADDWNQQIEVVARFEGDAYSGPDRQILRVFRPQIKTDVLFGDVVNFYGYDISASTLHPGETLQVKYYWLVEHPTNADYIVFNHLLHTQSGAIIAQLDRPAGHNGNKPSSQWEPKEWLFDHFDLQIPADAPTGEYRLAIGLYNSADGRRLTLAGYPDGVLPLATIIIESAGAE